MLAARLWIDNFDSPFHEQAFGVAIDALYVDGPSDSLSIGTSPDGIVYLFFVGNDTRAGGVTAGGSVGIASSPDECSDTAYNKDGWKDGDTIGWYFNHDTTPTTQVSKAEAESALRAAFINLTASQNNCGMADQVSATSSYLGNTTGRADINADGSCNARDEFYVADFGDLPSNNYGVACTWTYFVPFANDEAVEGDVRLNKVEVDWTVTPGSNCSNDYDVEGSATHEWGHVFGLAHVSESAHANLTMSEIEGPCTASQRSLGKGDVLGLRELY